MKNVLDLDYAINEFMGTLNQARSAFHNSEMWYSEGNWDGGPTFQEQLDTCKLKIRDELTQLEIKLNENISL